jgi:hypothetical protein
MYLENALDESTRQVRPPTNVLCPSPRPAPTNVLCPFASLCVPPVRPTLLLLVALADYIVVDLDRLGFPYGGRQNHVIVCIRFLRNRDTGGH